LFVSAKEKEKLFMENKNQQQSVILSINVIFSW
jgi:hypothetical protein